MSFKQKFVHIFRTNIGGRDSPTLRRADGSCIRYATDYLESLFEQYNSRLETTFNSAVWQPTYAISEFFSYLIENGIDFEEICDKTIEDFRNFSFSAVGKKKSSRGFEHQRMATVNHKLRHIYNLLDWCQEFSLSSKNSIGWHECKVKSSLPNYRKEPNNENGKYFNKYPKIFRNFGENSRESPNQYWATAKDIRDLEDYFWSSSPSVALRNTIMLRIMDIIGWRIGSANSILVTQFSEEAVAQRKNQSTYVVTPPIQKFGYQKPFPMPWELALQIKSYVEDETFGRAALMRKFKHSEVDVAYRLFLSTRDGKPLATGSWVDIFSDAFTEVGAPKGSGGHSIRRGAADRRSEETIASLQEAGLPVTPEAVVIEVMEFLGHASSAAQAAYRRVTRRRRKKTFADVMAAEIEQRKLQGDELRAALLKERSRVVELQRLLTVAQKSKPPRRTKREKKPSSPP